MTKAEAMENRGDGKQKAERRQALDWATETGPVSPLAALAEERLLWGLTAHRHQGLQPAVQTPLRRHSRYYFHSCSRNFYQG